MRKTMMPTRAVTGVAAAGVWVVALLLGPAAARAGDAQGPKDNARVDAFSGQFNSSVPIGVPAFRGLEPKLALEYRSGGRDGFAGVGWDLAGSSRVERASLGRGAPRFDSTDVFVLDGQELIPCQSGSTSPSCLAGGTHSTRIEGYDRIAFDGGANWTVWRRDGTRLVYQAQRTAYASTTTCTPVQVCSTPTITASGGVNSADKWIDWVTGSGASLVVAAVNNDYYRTSAPSQTIALSGATASGSVDAYPILHVWCSGSTLYLGGSGQITFSGATCAGDWYSSYYMKGLYGSGSNLVFCDAAGQCRAFPLTGTQTCTTLQSCGQTCTATPLGTSRWALASVTDTKGNAVTYNYWCDGQNECYPDTIAYNGTVVTFVRETRPDPITYGSGSCAPASLNYRLKTIDVTVSGSRARAYALGYAASGSTSRSLLQSVRQYGRDATLDGSGTITGGTALPAMILGWQQGGTALGAAASWVSGFGTGAGYTDADGNPRVLADVNGDGKRDVVGFANDGVYVALATGTGFGAPSLWVAGYGKNAGWSDMSAYPRLLADVNGDGKADIVGFGDAGTYVSLSTGSAFAAPSLWVASYGKNAGGWTDNNTYPRTLGDVNGDGKADVVGFAADGAYVSLSTGTGFGAPSRWVADFGTATGYESAFKHPRTLADVNGDGRADVVGFGAVGVSVSLSTGGAFAAAAAWVAGYGTAVGWTDMNVHPRTMADVNGDGRADVVGFGDSGAYVSLSTGAGFTAASLWVADYGKNAGGWSDARTYPRTLADVNGDGRADVVGFGAGGVAVSLSTGTGFAAGSTWVAYYGTSAGGFTDDRTYPRVLADVDGDGKADVVGFASDGVYVSTSQGAIPDLLASMANGIGGVTTIGYQPSSRWSNTFLPEGLVFPTVASVTLDDGRGEVRSTIYAYQGALWYAPDREFLGFREATTTLAATGAYSQTYYWQRQGTVAKPEKIYKKRADGAVMSFETFRFTENATAPYTSLVTEIWAYECNGNGVFDANQNYVSGCRRVASTYAWDQYANLTTETQYGDYDVAGDERTAARSFAANLSAYVVGLPAWDNVYAGVGTGGQLLARTRFCYDGATAETTPPTAGALTKKEQWNDQTGGYVSHTFAYDAYGNETAMTDPLGRTGTKEYDPTYHQYVTATVKPLGHRVESAHDYVLGQVTSKRDANGNVTTYLYNALSQPTEVDGPDGSATKYEYLDYGNAAQQRVRQSVWTGAAWVWEDNYFDGLGREYKKVAQNGVVAETLYGVSGKVWKQRLPYGPGDPVREDVYTYDDLGRQMTLTRPDGAVVQRSYGNDSVTTTEPVGTVRTVWSDPYKRLVKVREVVGGQNQDTTFAYDALGRRTRSVDALGNVTTASYDSLGRILQKSDPDQGLWRYAYDDAGHLTAETDALNQTTTLGYDALGRVTRRTYADGSYDSFTLDEAGHGSATGRLTTAVSASGVTTRASYDSLGRRTSYSETIDGTTYTISHTYDVTGRVLTVTYPDGEVVTFGYGTSGLAQGRLVSVSGKVTDVTYDARGKMTSLTYTNGVTTSFGLDSVGERVTQIQIGSLAAISYGYDGNGRVTSMSSPQLGLTSWSYTYDELGRLRTATNAADSVYSQRFSYDALGRMACNSKQGNYTYGAAHPHAVTAAGADTYAYDSNGNMTAGGGRSYAYDLDHKPVSITYGGNTTSFVYDALGVRVKKSSSQGTVTYVGSLYEKRGSAVTKYYYAGALRVAKQDASGVSYFHTDQLGSTRLMTDAAGAEVKRYEYAPYGKLIAESGTRSDSHRFTGKEADDETGLIYFTARYYDPALGRFVQPDPILPNAHNPQDLDVYAYAYNSPLNFVDPSGHAEAAVSFLVTVLGVSETVATIIIVATTVIGVALTYTNDPWLQTIGMIMAGVGAACMGGPLAGLDMGPTIAWAGAVALAQSPVSPLDPTVKKAIGWAYTVWGGLTNIGNEMDKGAGLLKAVVVSGMKEAAAVALAVGVGYAVSKWGGTGGRYFFAFLSRYLAMGGTLGTVPESWWLVGGWKLGGGWPGALSMVGATYDLAYSLRYPDGQVIDLSGGAGGDTFTFYSHPGYGSPLGLGRQHIRVGDASGYWEIGDFKNGHLSPGLDWGGWVGTRKVTVIMSPMQAAAFRGALDKAASGNGGYLMFTQDSYTYVSASLQFATGKSAADLHISEGLLNWK